MKLLAMPVIRHLRSGKMAVNVTANPPKPETGSETTSDPEQLRALVEEHADSVYRLALSICRDQSLAEDIAQEAMVKAWLALPTFRGDGSLRGWLLRITHNTAISVLRSRRAVVMDPIDINDLSAQSPGPEVQSVEQKVQTNAAVDEFTKSLDLLDELSRSIVVLREVEGMSYDEIAEVLEVPLPTVKTRLLRARRRLSIALKEWG